MAGVFISYRRSDSAGHTGRLASDLAEGLEEQQLFRDIEAIEAGEDFVDALQRAVSACSVMLVVIGPTWATAQTATGKRRIKEPGDFVRMEIEAALNGNVRVIPVLVGDAQMPQAEDLPESMHGLLRRNAYMISDRRWQYDVDQLLTMLEKLPGIARRRDAPHPAPATATARPTRNSSILKIAIGAVFGILLLIGGVAIFVPDEHPAADGTGTAPVNAASALPPPAAPVSAEHQPFVGVWRSETNVYFDIAVDGDALSVVTGELIDPANGTEAKTATAAGMELVGRGTVTDGALTAMLTDTFANTTDKLEVTPAEDGQTLEGTLVHSGGPPVEIVLRRV